MNQLDKTFEGDNFRIVGFEANPLFVLTDVCKVLEIGNTRQVKTRYEDRVITNEDDIILDSREPQAKRSRK